jgi:hypothetical protein
MATLRETLNLKTGKIRYYIDGKRVDNFNMRYAKASAYRLDCFTTTEKRGLRVNECRAVFLTKKG